MDTWSGNINNWLEHGNKLPMAGTISSFGDIAVTATGSVYGIAKTSSNNYLIKSWVVGDDLLDWTEGNDIDIGDAWD